jgi:RNA polymerase sigma-70 factor (ECF subfamily)
LLNNGEESLTADKKICSGRLFINMRRQKLNALIRQAIAGNALALEQLCQLYAKTILFQVRLLVRNKEDAEDVAQKVAIAMLRDIQMLRSPFAFRSWLQRLIINACNKQNAQTQREFEHTESLSFADTIIDESPEAQLEDTIISRDMRRFVGGYLERLPAAQAIALTLYYYEELSYKEVAAVMDVSVGSVSNTISKAKQNLRKLLKERGEQDVMGIVFIAPFLRGNMRRTVTDEIDSSVSEGSVTRFMHVCKSHITGLALTAGAPIATTGTWGALLAIIAAFVLLGGIGIGTLLLNVEPPPAEVPEAQETVITIKPESRVTYSIAGEHREDNPVDPLTVKLRLLGDEQLDRWVLTDAKGAELLSGKRDIGVIDPIADAETAEASGVPVGREVEGDFIDIASLELSKGNYTLSWYLLDAEGRNARVYWDFSITATPPE